MLINSQAILRQRGIKICLSDTNRCGFCTLTLWIDCVQMRKGKSPWNTVYVAFGVEVTILNSCLGSWIELVQPVFTDLSENEEHIHLQDQDIHFPRSCLTLVFIEKELMLGALKNQKERSNK